MVRGLVGSGGGTSGSIGAGTPGADVETGVPESVEAARADWAVIGVGGMPGERRRSGGSGVTALMVRPCMLDLKLERRLLADGLSMARWTSGAVLLALSTVCRVRGILVAGRVHPLTLIGGLLMPSLVHAHSGPASGWLSGLQRQGRRSRDSTNSARGGRGGDEVSAQGGFWGSGGDEAVKLVVVLGGACA
jgi:hypothetical protein